MKFLIHQIGMWGEPNGWSCWKSRGAFQQIVDLAIFEQVDGVTVGDFYDCAVPPVDAIQTLIRPWHV